MYRIKPHAHVTFLLLIAALFSNCHKAEDIKIGETTFASIYPATAGGGDYITLIGTDLAQQNQIPVITINNIPLTIVKQGADSIKVIIPKLIGSGKVIITVNGKTYTGPYFTYKYKATVTTLAGSGVVGITDGALKAAAFNCPWGITQDTNGDLYIADCYNRLIRKISAADSTVTTIPVNSLDFYSPYNITIDKSHNLFVTDFNKHLLKIAPGGAQTVIYNGDMVGTGIAVGADNDLYVSDNNNSNIKKFSSSGSLLSTFTSNILTPRNIIFDNEGNMFVAAYDQVKSAAAIYRIDNTGAANEVATDKDFGGWEIAVDKAGNFYEADHFHNLIRMIDKSGNAITIAGSGAAADVDGIGTNASFNGPQGLTIGGDGSLYVTTYNYDTAAGNKVRKILVE